MKAILLATCSLGVLADLEFIQKNVRFITNLTEEGNPSSTCSRMIGANSFATCPQRQCYGDSACCLATGQCTNFASSICADLNRCTDGPCGSSESGFPRVTSSANPASHHQRLLEHDGCTCVKAFGTCTSGACWGTMQCTGMGSCQTTGLCTAGTEVSMVGDFCVALADDPTCFKFCGWTTTTTSSSPISLPTMDPTHSPTTQPTMAPTTTTTTSCDTVSCEIYYDPHMSGFDDSMNNGPASLGSKSVESLSPFSVTKSFNFDGHPVYSGVGDVWLIKSELLSVQGHYVESTLFKTGGAVMGKIAMAGPILGGQRLVIEPRQGNLTWDGRMLGYGKFSTSVSDGQITVVNGAKEYHTTRPFNRVEVRLPMSVSLAINRYDEFLNVKITMPKVGLLADSHLEGQCGNNNGAVKDDEPAAIASRMSDVLPSESLLQ